MLEIEGLARCKDALAQGLLMKEDCCGCLNVWNVLTMVLAKSLKGGKVGIYECCSKRVSHHEQFAPSHAAVHSRGTRNLIRELSLMIEDIQGPSMA